MRLQRPSTGVAFVLLWALAGCQTAREASPPTGLDASVVANMLDVAGTPRAIRAEPRYASSRPLYQLLLFENRIPMWLVLDQSDPSLARDHYDVLHVDLDADGDLTDPGERLLASYASFKDTDSDSDLIVSVWNPERLVHPGSGVVQTSVEFSWELKPGRPGRLHFSLDCQPNRGFSVQELASMMDSTVEEIGDPSRWKNQRAYGGPAAQGADPRAGPSPDPATAPIFVVGGESKRPVRMLAYRRRLWDRVLVKGEENDLAVTLVMFGDRPGATTGLDLDYLPDGEAINVRVDYLSSSGVRRRHATRLTLRC